MELVILFGVGVLSAVAGLFLLARDARARLDPEDLRAVFLVAAPAEAVEQHLDRTAGGLPVTIEPIESASAGAWHGRVIIEGQADRSGGRLRLATVAVGQALDRASVSYELSGPLVEDIPWGLMIDPTVREAPAPPVGAPLRLWLASRWTRQVWATPERRAVFALVLLGIAGWMIEGALEDPLEFREERGWFVGAASAPMLLVGFVPLLVASIVDLAQGRNRFPPHLTVRPPKAATAVAVAAGLALALRLATYG